MDRRSFLKGLGVAAAGGWGFLVSACGRGRADQQPFDFGRGEMLVVDEDPGELFFSGGITKQSDGSYFAVYQRQPRAGSAYVRGRTLLPVGPEEVFYDGRSIDPSVTTLASGETLINLHRRGAIWLIVREGDGTFTQPIEVGPAGESMISTVGTRTFVAYAEAQSPDV
ncbi:MAG: twin-arginine translocation signal domain-containing protein, partial [Actinomycetota bacterium]